MVFFFRPFLLALASTILRNQFGMKMSSQGLIPFIKLNDYQVEDSQKCIEYLTQIFQKDMNAQLTEDQKAISRAVIKLCEDSLRWCLVVYRFWLSNNAQKETGLPLLVLWYMGYKSFRAGWYNGYARFTEEELMTTAKNDLKALNTIIGKNKFLFSDTIPCEADFSIFGVCAQIVHNDRGTMNLFLRTECPNVFRHTENMKQTYWKDWDSQIRRNFKKMKIENN